MGAQLRTLAEHRCFGGIQRFIEHDAREIGLPMRFAVFLPPQAALAKVPALLYGYDHSYYFVQSFMADHLRHHQRILFQPS